MDKSRFILIVPTKHGEYPLLSVWISQYGIIEDPKQYGVSGDNFWCVFTWNKWLQYSVYKCHEKGKSAHTLHQCVHYVKRSLRPSLKEDKKCEAWEKTKPAKLDRGKRRLFFTESGIARMIRFTNDPLRYLHIFQKQRTSNNTAASRLFHLRYFSTKFSND